MRKDVGYGLSSHMKPRLKQVVSHVRVCGWGGCSWLSGLHPFFLGLVEWQAWCIG